MMIGNKDCIKLLRNTGHAKIAGIQLNQDVFVLSEFQESLCMLYPQVVSNQTITNIQTIVAKTNNSLIFDDETSLKIFVCLMMHVDAKAASSKFLYVKNKLVQLTSVHQTFDEISNIPILTTTIIYLDEDDFFEDQPIHNRSPPLLPHRISLLASGRTKRSGLKKLGSWVHHQYRLKSDLQNDKNDFHNCLLEKDDLLHDVIQNIINHCGACRKEATSNENSNNLDILLSRCSYDPTKCGRYANHRLVYEVVQKVPKENCRLEIKRKQTKLGVHELTVQATEYKTQTFIFTSDISSCVLWGRYASCYQKHHYNKLQEALRLEVQSQIQEFVDQTFGDKSVISCPFTSTLLTKLSCHVDHISPMTFQVVVRNFWKEIYQEGELEDRKWRVALTQSAPYRLTDERLATKWRRYHAQEAKLRVVSREANQGVVKKTTQNQTRKRKHT